MLSKIIIVLTVGTSVNAFGFSRITEKLPPVDRCRFCYELKGATKAISQVPASASRRGPALDLDNNVFGFRVSQNMAQAFFSPGASARIVQKSISSIFEVQSAGRTYLSARKSRSLARSARRAAKTINNAGRCLWGVFSAWVEAKVGDSVLGWNSLVVKNSKGKSVSAGSSAHNFLQWAKKNPRRLCTQLGLAQGSKIKAGRIVVFAAGSCGFSDKHGHIEIVTGKRKACSDHCRPTDYARCSPDLVLAPVSSCDFLDMSIIN